MNGPERRRHDYGRRSSDEVLDVRLKAAEKLLDALGPAVAQVARIDDAVNDLERWIEDERHARRQHNSELQQSMRELRTAFGKHKEETTAALKANTTATENLGIQQREGRRAFIVSIVGSVVVLVGALATATALIVSAGHHP